MSAHGIRRYRLEWWLGAALLVGSGGCEGDHHPVGTDYAGKAGAMSSSVGGLAGSAADAGEAGIDGGRGGRPDANEAAGEGGEGIGAAAGEMPQSGGEPGASTGGKGGNGSSGRSDASAGIDGGDTSAAGAGGEGATPDCIELGNCEVPPLSPLVAQTDSTCYLRPDAHLECWGADFTPRVGSTYVRTPPGGAFLQLGRGFCGIDGAGELYCFTEYETYPGFTQVTSSDLSWVGLRADGTVTSRSDFPGGIPGAHIDSTARFKSIAAGEGSVCGLHADGTATCWPEAHVSLGIGGRHACLAAIDGTMQCWGDDSLAQASPPDGGNFIEVSAGPEHSCAVKATGELDCWGENAHGEASPPPGTYAHVASGNGFSCAYSKPENLIRCWGALPFAESDIKWLVDDYEPPPLVAGDKHVCTVSRSVLCFGDNSKGQASPPSAMMTAITAGKAHTCGLLWPASLNPDPGPIQCWGDDTYGQSSPPAGDYAEIAAGAEHTCARTLTGEVTCWGRNDQGQASPPSDHFVAIGAGGALSCGVTVTGRTVCWGEGAFGQLEPPAAPTFSEIAMGGDAICGSRTDGKRFCADALAGLDTLPNAELHGFAVGPKWRDSSPACALRADDSVVCWGETYYPELLSPPPGAFDFVTLGTSHACGLRPNGTIECWGHNGSQQLMVPPDLAAPQ